MTTNRTHRYHRFDFGPLPATLEHLDLAFDFRGDGTVGVVNRLQIRALQPCSTLRLAARDLDIHSVACCIDDDTRPLEYTYHTSDNVLEIPLPEPLAEGAHVTIETRTSCRPLDNVLEGIYKDTTPDGAPQQYISQCQQWGFQRIAPIIDDCRAKCTMRTTIEADVRYTHLISNGNICSETNPEGTPVPKPGDDTRQLMTYDNPIPMAPYLFLVAVGTWDVLADEVTYPSGKTVTLEYLVPPGRLEGARVPMQILKDSVLWQNDTQEYEYRHDVYRTICMEKSNFGGMENVGNTTIITDAALIDDFTDDTRLQYAHGVIVHEFEHNQCGSDVTMETPFDMWLNEAFTVDVERQFLQSQFDPACVRVDEIDDIRAPIRGPLAIEEGGHQGNIVREAFNDPDELVDGVTYVKAAEVIRMLKDLLGPALFREAKNTYFERYNGRTANTDDFFACFEEISGRDLTQFRQEWLHSIGYPQVSARYDYDHEGERLTVHLAQTRVGEGGPFHIPFAFAAVFLDGKDASETVHTVELTDDEQVFAFPGIKEPAFISFNRGSSFYGTFRDHTSGVEQLHHQVWHDPDYLNRIEAMRRLTDMEKTRLMADPQATVSEEWLFVYGRLLESGNLPAGILAYLLQVDELCLDRSLMPRYRARYQARQTILKTVAETFMDKLMWLYDGLDTYAHTPELKEGFEHRLLKRVLLEAIAAADSPYSHFIAEDHFRVAWHITERASALSAIHASTSERRSECLDEALQAWQDHLSGYTTYLRVLGSAPRLDCLDLIAKEEAQPRFQPEHPSHSRALYLPVTLNNAIVWTDAGIAWLEKTILKQSGINENTAIRLLATWQLAHALEDDLKPKVLGAIERLATAIDSVALPALSGRLNAYLTDPLDEEGSRT